MAELVTVERRGVTAVLTLNDPGRRNILTMEMVAQIASAVDELEADPCVQALIVTGAGSAFCAGAELATLEQAAAGDFSLIRNVYGGFLRILRSPLLTIAAVNGPAVGAGLNLALACDIRIAATSAQFVCRFADLGIFPGGGHTWLLTRAVGEQEALAGLMLGRTWDAKAAHRVGLVLDLVVDDRLLEHAELLARRLELREPEYTRRLLEVLRNSRRTLMHEEALEIEATHQRWSTLQPAFLDGLRRMQAHIAGTGGPT